MNSFFNKATVIFCILFSGCVTLGLNFRHQTPGRASKIPHFTTKDSLLGSNHALRNCFDVSHYDIRLRLEPQTKEISGCVTTRFRLLRASDRIRLDLDERLVVDSITDGCARLDYERIFSGLHIRLAQPDTVQAVSVYYHGKPKEASRPPWEGGLVWKKDANKSVFAGVACEGEGALLWLPVKGYLGDEPDSADMRFEVPGKIMVISNGILADSSSGNGYRKFHWRTNYPINPYNITFYAGDYLNFRREYKSYYGKMTSQDFYVMPQHLELARVHFRQTDSMLYRYERLFGEYPWMREGYKLVESPYEGMEHQTAIAYGAGFKNLRYQDFDYIILHETAHEWWGNSVSVSDFADIWIHEGLATYAEALYVEGTKGYQSYLNYLQLQSIFIRNKKPVVGPAGVHYWNYRDGDPYNKGALMLHSLRNHLRSDSLFFSILKAFYERHKFSPAATEDFISLANELSGRDLSLFFEQYLLRRESPLLRWDLGIEPSASSHLLFYYWGRAAAEFTTPIEVIQGDAQYLIFPSDTVQRMQLRYSPREVPVTVNSRGTYLENRKVKIRTQKNK